MPDPVPADTSLADFFQTIYLPRHLAGLKPETIQLYRFLLRHFREYLQGPEPTLTDLTDANLLGYCRWRLDHGGNQTTVVVEFSRLRGLWKWASERRYVPAWPDAKCPFKVLRRTPTAWTPEQVSRLVAACVTIRTYIAGIPGMLWWQAFLLTALDTGFRKGALLGLRWPDVDLEAGTILARAEDAKTAQDEMRRVAPDTVLALRRIVEPTRGLFFPWDRDRTTYDRHYDRILKAAGLPGGNRNKTHKMRRTTATWTCQLGGIEAAQQSMGHTSVGMTTKHYIDRTFLPASNYASRFPRPVALESASGNGHANGNGRVAAAAVGAAAIEVPVKPVEAERTERRPIVGEEVFTTGQVAKICKAGPSIVKQWIDSGRLKGYRIPGSQHRRIPREYLIRFLKEHGKPLGDLEDKAMVGARAFDYYDKQAKERQKERRGDQPGAEVANLPPLDKSKARDAAGKAVGVSGKAVGVSGKTAAKETVKPVPAEPPEPLQSVPQAEDEWTTALAPGDAPAGPSVLQEARPKARPSVPALDIPIPQARLGDMVFCRLAGGEVKVSGFMGPWSWPAHGPGNHLTPIVTDDLARALRMDRPKQVAEILGVSRGAVVKWARQVGNRDLVAALKVVG